jgi:SAM-dependent methyltransferase
VDLQERMLASLRKRLDRRGLLDRVETRRSSPDDLGVSDLDGKVDLVLAIYVLHEMPEPAAAVRTLSATLRPGGSLLIFEPRGHCSAELFQREIAAAREVGLVEMPLTPELAGRRRQVVLLGRPR